VFVPGKPFQPSLMFVGKTGANFQVLNSRVGSWPYPPTLDKARRPPRDTTQTYCEHS